MKTTNHQYVAKRLHSQLKGTNTILTAKGDNGHLQLSLISNKYRVVAINKSTKQHFVKNYSTLPGAMVAFDTLKENWV